MIAILGLVLPFVQTFLTEHGQKLPAEVLGAVQTAYNALAAHRQDLITKADLEAQRG